MNRKIEVFHEENIFFTGGVFSVVGVFVVVLFSFAAIQGSGLDNESKAYVDQVTTVILADLKKETVYEYAADQFKTAVPEAEMDQIFKWFEQLGEFEKYNGSQGQANVSIMAAERVSRKGQAA